MSSFRASPSSSPAANAETLSEEDFFEQANAACRQAEGAARQQIANMSPLPTSPAFEVGPELAEGFRRFWLVQRDMLRNILDRLDGLEPPAPDRDTINELLDSLRRDVEIGDRWLEAYENSDEKTMDELANAEIGADFNRRAKDLWA